MVTVATLFAWWPIVASAQTVTFESPRPHADSPLGHHKVALGWFPPESGTASSYILEAGTTPGASDVFNGSLGLTTAIEGVIPPGTYYVRVRAVNSSGVRPPSNEVAIVIGDGPPGKPDVTSVDAPVGSLTVSWDSGRGPTPDAHRLDFFSGAGPVASLNQGAETSVTMPIPPTASGTFSVTVTAFNQSVAGPASEPFIFTLESTCRLLASPEVGGGVVGGVASVSWLPVPGATSYVLSAGTSVPSGFIAWVRVIAVNACGQRSAPRDVLVQ